MGTRSPKPAIASFDVFDTILTRRVGDPRAVFLLLGRQLQSRGLIECSPESFARARTEAEVRTFRNAGGLDSSVSLTEIHRDLADAIHVPTGVIDKFIAEELALEAEMLVPMSSGVALVDAARSRGEDVVYVSDMYVGRDFLVEQLERHGLFEPGDRLYLSNEVARSKASGALWQLVIDDLAIDPSRIHHVGNDKRSDDRMARRAGLGTTLVDQNNLNRYERALETHSFSTDGVASALAGASRLARLDDTSGAKDRTGLREVAAGVVAPFVVGKVLWVLERAMDEGLEAIYFVARDGQILHEVAQELAPKVGYSGDLQYIYGSRQAWALPSMTDSSTGIIETLCPDGGDIDSTLRTVLHRFSIEPEEIEKSLTGAGFSRAGFDEMLDVAGRTKLRALLTDDPHVRGVLDARATKARELMLRYLDQVGMIGDRPIGLVDLGTGATLYNALAAVLETVDQRPPTSFYFGLRSDVTDKGYGFPLTYVRNEAEGLGYLQTPGLLTLVEMVCTADHGSVTGYVEEGDYVVSTFGTGGNQPVVDWGLAIVREAIRRVAEELVLDPEIVQWRQVDLRPAVLDVFELFWKKPTVAEAAAWGCYPFEDGWGEDAIRHPIAERRGPKSALQSQPYRHWWPAGAQQLSGPLSRTLQKSRAESVTTIKALKRRIPG